MDRAKVFVLSILGIAWLGIAPGCRESDPAADAGGDVDSDTDADTDGDSLDCAGGRYDQSTGLCWQHPKEGGTVDWQEALDYCDGLELGGHDDWYLPDRQDYVDLLGDCDAAVSSGDIGHCNTCGESETCSALFGTENSWLWTSSPYGGDMAWVAGLGEGMLHIEFTHYLQVKRCVRSEP
jgi:hypothetical protein